MPETPKLVREYLETIKQELGPDGKRDVFDQKEYAEEELGWVHSKAGMLLGYILHKLMIVPAAVGAWVLNKAEGICKVIGVAGYTMTLQTKDREMVTSMDASTKITNSLALGWNRDKVLAIFVPDDPRWSGLINAVWLQTMTDEDGLDNLAVYSVVDSYSVVRKGTSAYYLIKFQLGIYPLMDKRDGICTVAVAPDFELAKGLFKQESNSRPYELAEHLEGLALVNPINHTAVVKLWGPNDFFWDSTARAP